MTNLYFTCGQVAIAAQHLSGGLWHKVSNTLCAHLQTGIISSGNSLDYTKQDMDAMVKNEVAVKDMEAASIAWAADLYDTPWMAIKAITDIVDGALFLGLIPLGAVSGRHKRPSWSLR